MWEIIEMRKQNTIAGIIGVVLSLTLSSVLAAVPTSKGYADLNDQKLTYSLGQQAQGGTIIYVNAEGTHGLVAANTDQGGADLKEAFNVVTNPANFDRSGQVYTDWHLPSLYELTVMCKNKHLFPAGSAPAAATYWSSTFGRNRVYGDNVYTSARIVKMDNCDYPDAYIEGSGQYIRAVRTF